MNNFFQKKTSMINEKEKIKTKKKPTHIQIQTPIFDSKMEILANQRQPQQFDLRCIAIEIELDR